MKRRDMSIVAMLIGIFSMLLSISWMFLLLGLRRAGWAVSEWATGALLSHFEGIEGRRW